MGGEGVKNGGWGWRGGEERGDGGKEGRLGEDGGRKGVRIRRTGRREKGG